jgi:1-deoxy-D-xylulose 5-phosphate reductoisomerase
MRRRPAEIMSNRHGEEIVMTPIYCLVGMTPASEAVRDYDTMRLTGLESLILRDHLNTAHKEASRGLHGSALP